MNKWAIRIGLAWTFVGVLFLSLMAPASASPLVWQEEGEQEEGEQEEEFEDPVRQDDREPGTYSNQESDQPASGMGTATDLEMQAAREVYNDVTQPIEIGSRRLGRIATQPREVFRMGGFTFFPELREEVIWDSNLFLTERQVKSSWLFRHILGGYAYGEFADQRVRLDLGYQVEFNNYTRNPVRIPSGTGVGVSPPRDIDHSQQFANARLRFDYNRFFASAQWKYENLYDPIRIDLENPVPGSPLVFNGEDLRRNLVMAEARAGFHADDDRMLTFEGRYQFLSAQYNASQLSFFDSHENRFSARGSYRVAARHSVYGEFVYGIRDYTDPSNSNVVPALAEANRLNDEIYREYALGFTGEVQDNVTYEARLAYRYDNFEEDSALGFVEEKINRPGSSDNKHRDLVGSLAVTAVPTDELSVSARYLRAIAGSPSSNFQVIDRIDSYALYDFTPEATGRLAGFYEHSNPSNAQRVSRYGIGAGILYRLTPNVQLGLDYEYRYRISQVRFGDYLRHQFALTIALSF